MFLPANSKYLQKRGKVGLYAQIDACTKPDVDSATVRPALNFEIESSLDQSIHLV
jgi:hypothetical protein